MDVMNFFISNGYGTGVASLRSALVTSSRYGLKSDVSALRSQCDTPILSGQTSQCDTLIKLGLARTLWSSTENSQNNAWNVNFTDGNTNNNNKYNSNSVRAVAALDEEIKIGWIKAYDDCCGNKKSSPQCNDYRVDYEFDLWMLIASVYTRTYAPSISTCFIVEHPKLREIFAAHFRDRIVQHWIVLRLEPLFEKRFASHGDVSFNCRKNFGTQKAVEALQRDIEIASANYTKKTYVGRFDLKSFFMSIDLDILWRLLEMFIKKEYKGDDIDTLLYLTKITVFHRPQFNCYKKGKQELFDALPPGKSLLKILEMLGMAIGNHTSQQFANFIMSFFDEFMIWLCARYGCRYERFVDDFTVVGDKDVILKIIRPLAEKFLKKRLNVTMHRDKFYLQEVKHGIKFVGTVIMPGRKYISNRTVGGMMNKLRFTQYVCKAILRGKRDSRNLRLLRHCVSALNSYLGFMVHVNGHNVRHKVIDSASQDFWDVCFVTGDYTVIRIKKHYQLTTLLKEQADAENDLTIRQRDTAADRHSDKLRNETAHNKLRRRRCRNRKLYLPMEKGNAAHSGLEL